MSDLRIVGTYEGGDRLPIAVCRVSAGPPLPVDPELVDAVDLGELMGLTGRSFLVRVEGDSMREAGIEIDDVLVVDVGAEPVQGQIVIAGLGDGMTVKQVRFERGDMLLVPLNPRYRPIRVRDNGDVRVWGVVTALIRSYGTFEAR